MARTGVIKRMTNSSTLELYNVDTQGSISKLSRKVLPFVIRRKSDQKIICWVFQWGSKSNSYNHYICLLNGSREDTALFEGMRPEIEHLLGQNGSVSYQFNVDTMWSGTILRQANPINLSPNLTINIKKLCGELLDKLEGSSQFCSTEELMNIAMRLELEEEDKK